MSQKIEQSIKSKKRYRNAHGKETIPDMPLVPSVHAHSPKPLITPDSTALDVSIRSKCYHPVYIKKNE